MGIRNLNTYLKRNCSSKAIEQIYLKQLHDTTLVIDTSIYIYKYLSEGTLIESFKKLIQIFKNYRITPIFIFDGKPSNDKIKVLMDRYHLKQIAREQYYQKLEVIQNSSFSIEEKQQQTLKLSTLKRQFVRVTEPILQSVKNIFIESQVQYCEALTEADILCAQFTLNKKAFGCVSDDMDMFAYECEYIIRNIHLNRKTCILYDTKKIKKELQIPFLSPILVLCETDYTDNCLNIERAIHLFKKFRYFNPVNDGKTFHKWLYENKYINDEQNLKITRGYELFQIPKYIG